MCKKMKRKNNYPRNPMLWIIGIEIIVALLITFFGYIIALSLKSDFCIGKKIGCIIAAAISIILIIIFVVLFWKYLLRTFSKFKIDLIILLMFEIYLCLSFILAIFLDNFAEQEPPFERLDRMIQISWAIFGFASALYTAMVGFVLSRKDGGKTLLSHFLISIFPAYVATTTNLIATMMLYCFYSYIQRTTSTFVYIALISSIFSAPYYLASFSYFFSLISAKPTDKTTDSPE